MTTGIGAPVRRREDFRFITGKGQYTDDINRVGQAHAYFLRSPHAHATINSIDKSAAEEMPGVVAIFTGEDLAADKIGGLICGWMIHSKDGSPMKAGAHPALAQGKVRYVGDHVAVVIAETLAEAKDAAEAINVDYGVLPGIGHVADARKAETVIHDVAPDNTVFEWHIGDKDATEAAFAKAAHVTKLDLVNNRVAPNPMEPRAALGDYDSGTESFTLYTTSQNPHVARLVLSAFIGIAPEHKLRVVAPDVGGGFGAKIFIYAEETLCVWAAKENRPAGQMDVRSQRGVPLSDAHGRDHVTHAELAHRRPTASSWPCAVKTIGQSGRLSLDLRLLASRPISTRRCCRANTTSPPSTRKSKASIPTRRRSMPIAAPGGRRRPSSSSGIVEVAARETEYGPRASSAGNNYRAQSFPHQTPVIMCYDAGDYAEGARQGAGGVADYENFGETQAPRRRRRGKLRGLGILGSYIEACGIAPSAAVGSLGAGVGLWESAEVRVNPGRDGRGADRLAFARTGPRDDLRPARQSERLGIPIENVVHRAWRHRQGPDGHGNLWIALRRGRHVGDLRRPSTKIEAKATKVAELRARSLARRHRVQGRQVHGQGHRQGSVDFASVALQAYVAHKFSGQELEPGLKEGAFYDPTNFTFPSGVYICELRDRPRDRRHPHRALDRGRRFRRHHQPDDRRRARSMAVIAQGIGQALLEGRRLRRGRSAAHGELHGLLRCRARDFLPNFKVETR